MIMITTFGDCLNAMMDAYPHLFTSKDVELLWNIHERLDEAMRQEAQIEGKRPLGGLGDNFK